MKIAFQAGLPAEWTAAVFIVPLFENETPAGVCADPGEAAPWLLSAPGLADFRGRKDELLLLHGPAGAHVARVLLVGMGGNPSGKTRAERLDALRVALGGATAWCRKHGLSGALAVPVNALSHAVESNGRDERAVFCAVREAVCGALLGLYRNTAFKSGTTGQPLDPDPERLDLLMTAPLPEVEAAAAEGEIHAQAVMLARNLANAPANRLAPADLAEEAGRLAARHGLRHETLGMDDLQELGMGAFVAVGAGAAGDPRRARHAPCLSILEYAPAGHEAEAPLVVVGKGITFDSGGISLKPAAGMWEMKGDMGGAAAVLGLFEALPRLGVQRRVVGLLACAENMPGACASRPGDVVKTLSGKTVEIVNTDAEGRLVLCDALTYAQKRWSPDMLVDVATLTGACVVALGDDVAGLFCEEPELAARIKSLGEAVGEPFWPLPLHERYFEKLKSETADFANAGSREGGACSAAIFLKQFINPEDTAKARWAHLDIAGPAFLTRKVPNCPAGASGFAVRTLIDLASDRS